MTHLSRSSYTDSCVWIIGASSGIGRALAIELSGRGAILALSARREKELHALNAELGGRHAVFPLDVTDAAETRRTAQAIVTKNTRPLRSVVFMAGNYAPGAFADMDPAVMHRIVDVNLCGAFHVVLAVLPVFHTQGHGQIALCGSVASYRGLPHGQPYSATKAGLVNMAESLRVEMSGTGIDVKLISPGFVRTPMTDKNTFAMPLIISPEQAATAIANGLLKTGFEIHFPKIFTLPMKLLKYLPAPLYFKLAPRLIPNQKE